MSGATYRIDVEHRAQDAPLPTWYVTVVRISDGEDVAVVLADTEMDALTKAQRAIRDVGVSAERYSIHADDDGRFVEVARTVIERVSDYSTKV